MANNKKTKKSKDKINCPYCGTPHDVEPDTAGLDCGECGYKITIGKNVLPLSDNWWD